MARWTIDGETGSRRTTGVYGRTFAALAAMVLLLLSGATSMAMANESLAPPTGKVLLVVKGAITRTNVGGEAHLDRAHLESVGFRKIVTRTSWTDGDTEFEGILARDLMKALGATGTRVRAIAANDYKVFLPLSDFEMYDVLLAVSINGEKLRLRTKGPIWVIYPEDVNLAATEREERMIWQLVELRVE